MKGHPGGSVGVATAAGNDVRASGVAGVPRLVFWELTQGCNLTCQHCRAEAQPERAADELSLEECLRVVDGITDHYQPVLVLTGGEPLYRSDLFEIAEYASQKGARVCVATNGTLVNDDVARRLKDVGVQRVSISLDGSTPEVHDTFRGIPGAWQGALDGAKAMMRAGVEVQFNVTVAQHNKHQIPSVVRLAEQMGAAACHLFVLVPVGCGVQIAGREMLPPEEVEALLEWLYGVSQRSSIEVRATCAPQYHRIMRQQGGAGAVARARAAAQAALGETGETVRPGNRAAGSKGCLAGSGVCFISHTGNVQPCGYLPVSAGSVREQPFHEIWEHSTLFRELRNPSMLEGKCGACEYRVSCGGCRARAFYEHGSHLAEEPYCAYEPSSRI